MQDCFLKFMTLIYINRNYKPPILSKWTIVGFLPLNSDAIHVSFTRYSFHLWVYHLNWIFVIIFHNSASKPALWIFSGDYISVLNIVLTSCLFTSILLLISVSVFLSKWCAFYLSLCMNPVVFRIRFLTYYFWGGI